MQELIATFHIDWKLMLAQIFNFALVFAALYLIAAKPLRKLMAERTEEITKGLEDAKQNAEKLKATTADYEATLSKARTEANAIFDKTKKDAEAKRAEILAQAQAEMTATLENGRKILEADKAKVLADAKNEIASLVISATEKVLGEKQK